MVLASKVLLDDVDTVDFGVAPEGRVAVPTAERDVVPIPIKGRDGSLTKKYGYKDIIFPIRFSILSFDVPFKPLFRRVKPLFLDSNTLAMDDDLEVYYKIKSAHIEEADNTIKTLGKFTVNFRIDPFMYELENEPITITSRTTIENDGHEALPIITATCNGTGKIYVNEQEVIIQNVNGKITIDSEMKNAYRKSPTGLIAENMNKHMIGHFPVLQHGENVVEFSGNIDRLEIIPNRRWR